MEIATGRPETHETPLPLDEGQSPGVAPETPVAGQLSGPTYDARDTTAEFQDQRAAVEADCRAAQAAGMGAREAMLAHYQAQALPLGGHIGDDLPLPPVAVNAVPAMSSDLYPWQGEEPTPAGAGLDFYEGNPPR